MLRGAPNPLLDVVPAHPQAGAIASYPSDHDMSVWVFGIVMLHRNPFQVRTEVLFHTFHQIGG